MEMSNIGEKRKFPRVPVKTEILCYKSPEDRQRGTGVMVLFSRNISVGGLFMETTIPLDVNSFVFLKFKLPGSEKPITTQARVVRISKLTDENIEGIGCEFERVSYDEKRLIEEFVKGKSI